MGFLVLFLVFFLELKAQESATTKKPTYYDTTYIRQYRNKWCITFIGSKRDFFINITNPLSSKQTLTYSPKNHYGWGIGLDYKWFTLEFVKRVNLNTSPAQNYLWKNNFGIRLGLTRQKIWFNSFYQQYKGMNVNFVGDSLDKVSIANLPTSRNDIFTYSLHLSLNYGFNHRKYSQMAALWQIDRQLKSAGTVIAGLSSFIYHIKADSTLVPTKLNRYFNRESQVVKSVTKKIGINIGYAHNFIIREQFFIHLSFIPSIAYQYRRYDLVKSEDLIAKGLSLSTEARFIIGYNGEKWYGGFALTNYSFTENSPVKGAGAVLTYNFFRWFIGFRFKPLFKTPILDR
ncbi:protein of unknown function [Thermoflexibacter ruber]|uniref:DUF4421 domain-containing protein n=2 Tax=Thermoflexibacter ruber TaxID=1003 RepID=A0A1I2DLR3_9BACT|nr:protein of unknown function [Thermoflexibacter ruber]